MVQSYVQRTRSVSLSAIRAALIFATACRSNTSEACAIIRGDPLIMLGDATDARTGALIAQVTVKAAKVLGQTVNPITLAEFPPATRVVPTSSGLQCQVACGFGSHEGEYELVIGAAGYRDTTLVFRATYATLASGCPRRQLGSHRLRVMLEPV
jgi:hypothetical protein